MMSRAFSEVEAALRAQFESRFALQIGALHAGVRPEVRRPLNALAQPRGYSLFRDTSGDAAPRTSQPGITLQQTTAPFRAYLAAFECAGRSHYVTDPSTPYTANPNSLSSSHV